MSSMEQRLAVEFDRAIWCAFNPFVMADDISLIGEQAKRVFIVQFKEGDFLVLVKEPISMSQFINRFMKLIEFNSWEKVVITMQQVKKKVPDVPQFVALIKRGKMKMETPTITFAGEAA